MPTYKIEHEGDGFYTIRDVPIFKTHNDRGFECDETWMQNAIQNFAALKEDGYRPPIIVGHSVKGGTEKESIGFLDNLILKGKVLYADLTRLPKTVKEKLKGNSYPSRSVEVLPKGKRILALALLGGTTPHFSLPQMVYEREDGEEKSEWLSFDSLTSTKESSMAFTNEQKEELMGIVGEAVGPAIKQAMAGEASEKFSREKEEAPEIFELSTEDALGLLQSTEVPEIFEAEDGNFYSFDEGGSAYVWPQSVVKYLSPKVAAQLTKLGMVGRHHAKKAVGAVKAVAGKKNVRRVVAAHPVATAGLAGLAGLHTGATVAGRKKHKRRGYELDDETGIIYLNGEAVGEAVPYQVEGEETTIPTIKQTNPTLKTDPGDEGTTGLEDDPGSIESDLIEEVDEESSDQFAEAGAEGAAEGSELYALQQEVGRLQVANALVHVGRKAEAFEKYLLGQKTSGAPVGNIKDVVEHMMSLDDNQVVQFKRLLENQPKVQLGMGEESPVNFELEAAEIKQDFEKNRTLYARMGVKEADLTYAKYIRSS